jgi:hypothetical protein
MSRMLFTGDRTVRRGMVAEIAHNHFSGGDLSRKAVTYCSLESSGLAVLIPQ